MTYYGNANSNSANRMRDVTLYPNGAAGGGTLTTTYFYDARGNVSEVEGPDSVPTNYTYQDGLVTFRHEK